MHDRLITNYIEFIIIIIKSIIFTFKIYTIKIMNLITLKPTTTTSISSSYNFIILVSAYTYYMLSFSLITTTEKKFF